MLRIAMTREIEFPYAETLNAEVDVVFPIEEGHMFNLRKLFYGSADALRVISQWDEISDVVKPGISTRSADLLENLRSNLMSECKISSAILKALKCGSEVNISPGESDSYKIVIPEYSFTLDRGFPFSKSIHTHDYEEIGNLKKEDLSMLSVGIFEPEGRPRDIEKYRESFRNFNDAISKGKSITLRTSSK